MDYLEESVDNLTVVDADRAERELGSSKVLNVLLLGAACRSGALGLDAEDVRRAIRACVRERFFELNDRALDYGA
jgi:indolepyruvate ferredoxin oxidoreductase beta subunit